MARGGRGMAVHVPGEGITVGLGMPGRPRYGQRDGREWLCRYLEEGSLQEEGGQEGWWRVALDGYAGTLTGKMKCSVRRIFQGGIERVEGEANASEIFSPDSN